MTRARIGKLDVDVLTFAEALQHITTLVDAKRGGRVFTPNVDHVVLAEHDARMRDAYARASLSLADGTPVVWASRISGPRLPAKISGSDLVTPLMATAGERQWRVYLLGGADGVAAEVAALVTARHGVTVVGVDAPRVGFESTDEELAAMARVTAARPDLLFVALGSPKQELFIDRVRDQLGTTVAIGVGASFDFLTGRVRRSPGWVSAMGVEWLFRLVKEPRRLWRRYLVQDSRFVLVLLRMFRDRLTRRVTR